MRFPLALVLALALGAAQETSPGPSPDARGGHAMTYDPPRGVTLMFGGGNRERAFNDLWGWDGERWSLLSSSGPSARNSVTFDYDTRRHVAILVGGRTSDGLVEDTWEWDGQRWRERAGRGPGVRLHHFAAYDERRGRLVLYGGLKPFDNRTLERLTDTWEWDGATWTRRDARGIEAFPSSMTYDDRRGQVVMVAVDATSPPDGERPSAMWGWTGDAWARISDRFGDPALSPSQPMTSDPDGLLLLDGAMHKGNTAITWLWRNERWTRSGAAAPLPQRVSHAMAFDRRRNRVVLFGGHAGFMPGRSGEMFGDTWEWTGAAWERVHPGR